MPDKDLIKFIVRILVTSWSTRRFRIFEYHVPVIPESVVHKWHCLVGVLRDQVCRFACLGTKILVIILQSALSFRNDLIYFDSICIWSSWVAAQRISWTFFSFIFVAKEATRIWMPKLKARILNLFEEVIHVLRAWLHDHTLLVSYEKMECILLG